jgi:hypothetical protein
VEALAVIQARASLGFRMFKQTLPAIRLSVEEGTADVPEDGHCYVMLEGNVVFRSKSKSRALAEYQRLRAEKLPATSSRQVDREIVLQKERAHFDLRSTRTPRAIKSGLRVGGRRGQR